jgi:hypothetical protein
VKELKSRGSEEELANMRRQQQIQQEQQQEQEQPAKAILPEK